MNNSDSSSPHTSVFIQCTSKFHTPFTINLYNLIFWYDVEYESINMQLKFYWNSTLIGMWSDLMKNVTLWGQEKHAWLTVETPSSSPNFQWGWKPCGYLSLAKLLPWKSQIQGPKLLCSTFFHISFRTFFKQLHCMMLLCCL